ncbi:MAG TPA: DNA recombination protein RmuC [Rhodothermales bacterium]|nr:DNA recombination protein RmuC [Rhodothermales bacterium]
MLALGLVAAGAALGALSVWFATRMQVRGAVDKGRSESAGEAAALQERVRSRDAQIQALQDERSHLKESQVQWLQRAEQETERRAAAEKTVAHLSDRAAELGLELKAKEAKLQEQAQHLSEFRASVSRLQSQIEEKEKGFERQRVLLEEAERKLSDTFKALSSDALKSNNAAFVELAKATLETFQEQARGDLAKRTQAVDALVKPLHESLEKVNVHIKEVEKTRTTAYATLTEQVKAMQEAQAQLQKETGNLVKALGKSGVRGRWGEIQLRRVVEMAGMIPYCDFEEQFGIDTEEGRLRPDMVIKLPNRKCIVVDSKAPMEAYLESLEAPDEAARKECLQRHARQVRTHLTQLGVKEYASHLDHSPEFVVLFLPGEMLFSAALEADPGLIEEGVQQNIILATPTTLIALLRAVAYGWRQEQIAENALKISALGKELYQRVGLLADHLNQVGKHLDQTVRAYNKTAGSFESRFRVAARRFQELGAAGNGEIAPVSGIDSAAREIAVPELPLRLLSEGDGTPDPSTPDPATPHPATPDPPTPPNEA